MKVLCIAAHPDDEALGCGGTLARHAEAGDVVRTVFLADGVSSRAAPYHEAYHRRLAAMEHASVQLGVSSSILQVGGSLRATDNRLDSFALLDIVLKIEPVLARHAPDIIYTHHGGDLNVDHRVTHQAIMTACRPMPGSTVKAIYAFEVPSSTEWASDANQAFRPNHFVDIESTLATKIAALETYEEEMRPFPHPRSYDAVKALAAWRGASVGLKAAEAFMTIRRIEA